MSLNIFHPLKVAISEVSESLGTFPLDFRYTPLYDLFMSKENLSPKALEALKHIRNAVMHQGGVPSVRALQDSLGYKSPRSAMLILQELLESGFLKKRPNGTFILIRDLPTTHIARTVDIPLVGSVPCGLPLLAEENIEAIIPVSVEIAKSGSKYFLLRAIGNSMDKSEIMDGDLMVIRQQDTAENGQRVVALIDDNATVKHFYRQGDFVILKPNSTNPKHQPIILTEDFRVQGIVITTIPK